MTAGLLSERLSLTVPTNEVDIGGTDTDGGATTGQWQSLEGFEVFMFYLILNTFNATDTIDTLTLQQAQDSSGTGVKALTTEGAQATLDDKGDTYMIEGHASALDADGGFNHVRLLVGEVTGTATDEVTVICLRGNATHNIANLTANTTVEGTALI